MAVPLHNNSIPSYTSAVLFPSALRLCFALRLYSMPLRLLTVLFQDQAFLSYSAAFRSHSLAHLLRAVPFLHISALFSSIASPLPTVLALIRSARFQGLAVQCLRITFLGYAYAFLNFAMPFHFFATLGYSIPLPNLTFPWHCRSFLFHRLSRLINAVTDQCVAFPFLC